MKTIRTKTTGMGKISLAGAIAIALSACGGGVKPTNDIEFTRKAFEAARKQATIAYMAPIQMGEAEQALRQAEDALHDGDDELAAHWNYLAKKKLELAKLVGAGKFAERRYQSLAKDREDLIFALHQRELATAQSEAQKAEHRVSQLESDLSEFQVERTARGLMVTLGEVVFEFNKSDLKPGITRRLEPLIAFLKSNLDRNVDVDGHTDSVGDPTYNKMLSQKRADEVKAFLVNGGIAPERITAVGHGEDLPIASNDNNEGRQRNRRVEIVIKEAQ